MEHEYISRISEPLLDGISQSVFVIPVIWKRRQFSCQIKCLFYKRFGLF